MADPTEAVRILDLARWLRAQPIYLRGLWNRETRFLFVDFFRKLTPVALALGVWDDFRALYRSLFMSRRWPSFDYAAYLDVPLADIRREFGIRVI